MHKEYIDRSIIYINWIIHRVIDKTFQKQPNVLSIDDTIKYIIDNRMSVARFGDGEIKIINGLSLGFQQFDSQLSERLKTTLKSTNNNLLICIPDIFGNLCFLKKRARRYWMHHLFMYRLSWFRHINQKRVYGNAFISRIYFDCEDIKKSEKWFSGIRNIWQDRKILIVEGAESRIGVSNDLFTNSKSITRIICPSTNAYHKYDDILMEVKRQSLDSLVLVALGPTAKLVVTDLSKLGYQAIDIGHLDIEYEWYLLKTDIKVALPYKYVNEVKGQGQVVACNDGNYISQIVAKII